MRDVGDLRAPERWAWTTVGDVRRDESCGIEPAGQPDTSFELYSIPGHDAGGPEIVLGREIGSNKQTVAPSTVLLSKINPRINRVRVVGPSRGLPQIASTEWIPFWPVPGIEPEFLAHFLRREEFRNFLAQNASGVGGSLMRVRAATMADVPLPLPAPAEQRRIVAALEQQLSRIEAGVAALERAKSNLERYRASVLKAACEGRLVLTEAELARAEGRTYEPASELLARILKERRERWEADQLARMKARGKPPKDDAWKKKYPEPAAPDTSALPELPEGWCWGVIDQLSDAERSVTYGVVKLGEPVEGGIPTLRSSNVRSLRLQLDGLKRISPSIESGYQRTRLRGGELLVTVRGTLGGVVVTPASCAGWNISREVAMIALSQPEVGSFMAAFLASPNGSRWITANSKGIAYTGINIETLKEMPIPIPPLSEQQRIVGDVERLLSLSQAVLPGFQQAKERASRLRQSLLAHAFSGKLVPQDPTDEPASVLLERIRKEREAAAAEKPKQPARRGSPQRGPRKTAPKGPR